MKVLIADDHPILRLGVRQLILGQWPAAHVIEAENCDEALRRFAEHQPDIVLLDLLMPDTAGVESLERLLKVAGKTPILVLSSNSEAAYASRLLVMGAAGYLPKNKASTELVIAVQRIMDGKRYVSAFMADHLVDVLGGRVGTNMVHEQLSAQEHRVMLLMASGEPPAKIAKSMHLSAKTIGTYRARIFEKTGWKNNVELTKYCVQNGLAEIA